MENSNEEFIKIKMKYNQKLFKFYKMISWDLIFYYAISFLFLTQEKGLSTSQIIFADAFYPIFKILFQLPITILVKKIGKKKTLMIGNLSLATYVLIVMGLSSTLGYIISDIFCALGFVIKGTIESNFLYDSIENNENKRSIFSRIDSSGSALYFFFDAITSAISGFLFVVNPYIPMCLCLILTLCSFGISCKFKEIPINKSISNNLNDNNYDNLTIIRKIKIYIKDLKKEFKFIFNSNRLRALILFYAIFSTLISLLTTLRRSLLKELSVPNEYFGILFAIWGLIAAFSVKTSNRINKKYGNQTLSILSLSYVLSILFCGLISILNGLPSFILFFIVFCLISIQYAVKGPYQTLIQRYLGSFSTSTMRIKISSASMLLENITCTLLSFIISYLTNHISTALSTLIIGVVFLLVFIINLNYMKSRVGLNPEEYSNTDVITK